MSDGIARTEIGPSPIAPPEIKKWGFKLETLKDPVTGFFAREAASHTSDYNKIQPYRPLDFKDQSKLKQAFPNEYNEKTDWKTGLTNLSDMYKFVVGPYKQEIMCYNFTNTPLTEKRLFDIADGIGEMHIQSGGSSIKNISALVFLPPGHPNLFDDTRKPFADGTITEDGLLLLNPDLLSQESQEVNQSKDERPFVIGGNLKSVVMHEIGHFWADAYPELAKQHEEDTDGESGPSEHADTIRGANKKNEDLPETLTALSFESTKHLVGPKHLESIRKFQSSAHSQVAVPTIVTCKQLDPADFAPDPARIHVRVELAKREAEEEARENQAKAQIDARAESTRDEALKQAQSDAIAEKERARTKKIQEPNYDAAARTDEINTLQKKAIDKAHREFHRRYFIRPTTEKKWFRWGDGPPREKTIKELETLISTNLQDADEKEHDVYTSRFLPLSNDQTLHIAEASWNEKEKESIITIITDERDSRDLYKAEGIRVVKELDTGELWIQRISTRYRKSGDTYSRKGFHNEVLTGSPLQNSDIMKMMQTLKQAT